MAEKRITVWVQRFNDRSTLVLQWIDPTTGKRKSKSAETADEKEAEGKRADLEYELNNGRYQEASRMTWERFRELFEAEYLPNLRRDTRRNYGATLDLFEKLCHPTSIRGVTERTVSAFAAALRKEPGRGHETMLASTVRVRLQFLHKVPKRKPQPVPAETFERLLDKAPDSNMRVFLLSGWLSGLRLNEALALEWEESAKVPWVDFSRDCIILPAEFVKAVEDQWVPLDPVLRRALESLPRHGAKVFRFVAKDGHPLSDITVSGKVHRLARRAGVKLTMKALRRGFGCRYAGKVPAQVLQKLMRHSNIQITMSYYANVDDEVMKAVLGPQRNGLRNTQAPEPSEEATADSTNPLSDKG
jgi:integrase